MERICVKAQTAQDNKVLTFLMYLFKSTELKLFLWNVACVEK